MPALRGVSAAGRKVWERMSALGGAEEPCLIIRDEFVAS